MEYKNMMAKFNNWLRSEIDGTKSVNADTAFDFAARAYLASTGKTVVETATVNYSKRSQIKMANADRLSNRATELREGHNWLGRGIGARGDWDI